MKKIAVISVVTLMLVAFLLPLIADVAYAQVKRPDDIFSIHQVEAYRNCLELGDELYLITGTIEYSTNPSYPVSSTFIVRLMNGAVELGNTTYYDYYDDGYAYGMCSIYFNAADAPGAAWPAAYTMKQQGNPTLQWMDNTATTAMAGTIINNGGVLTDDTANANSAAASDMVILPNATPTVVDDGYYFGGATMFDILTVNIGQAGNYAGDYTWEYWNGSSWEEPDMLIDNTTGFTVGTGNYDVTYDCPEDWQTTTILGLDLYWLRFRIVTAGALVTNPLGTQSWTNASTTIPSTETSTFGLWYDDGTVAGTQERLTTRLRSLAKLIEDDWRADGWTYHLIETVAGEKKLTVNGEDYFITSIYGLRTMCPGLFVDSFIEPDFDERAYIEDYYMEGDDADYDSFLTNWSAQTFTPSSNYTIDGVELKMFRVGTPGVLTVGIKPTAAGVPQNVADIATGTIDADEFTTDERGAWYHVSFTDDEALTAGTVYAIVIRALAGGAGDYVSWRYDSEGTYAGGQAFTSINSGVAWIPHATEDFMFAVHATEAYSLSYRNRLAGRLVGTPLDMTALGNNINMSRMWTSTMVWLIFACIFPSIFVCKAADSFKPASLVFMVMLPFGALAGFIYLEWAIITAFLSAAISIYVFFYRGSP